MIDRELIFLNAPIPIAFVDRNGKFIKCNEQWSKLLGYSTSELENNLSMQDITHPLDIRWDLEMSKTLLVDYNNQTYNVTKRYITKEGKSVWASLFVFSIWESPNTFTNFILYVVPLPNGGKFKVEQLDDKNIHIRPTISLWQLVKDNKWIFGVLATILATLLTFSVKVIIAMTRLLDANGINW